MGKKKNVSSGISTMAAAGFWGIYAEHNAAIVPIYERWIAPLERSDH
jgi:hypothetical protein